MSSPDLNARSTSRLGLGLRALPPRQLYLALAAGLIVRLVVHALVAWHYDRGDGVVYDGLARGILEHGVYTDVHSIPILPAVQRAPLYPAFLALVYALFGHSYVAVWLIQVFIDLLVAVALAATIGLHLPKVGVAVLWAMCLSPFEAIYPGALLSETLCSALLVLAFCAPFLWRGWRGVLLCGVFLGLTSLTREVYMLAALPAALLLGWRDRRFATAALLIVGCAAVILPWSARNLVVIGRPIPISEGRLGFSLWTGAWATNGDFTLGDADGKPRVFPRASAVDDEDRTLIERAQHQPDAQVLDRAYRDSFVRHMKRHPLWVLTRWVRRAPLLWFSTRFDIFDLNPAWFPRRSAQWTAVKGALFLLDAVMVLLALAGLWLTARRRFLWAWWALPVAYTFAIYLPLNSFESRYSQPVLPFLMVFSVGGAVLLSRRFGKLRDDRSIAPSPNSARP